MQLNKIVATIFILMVLLLTSVVYLSLQKTYSAEEITSGKDIFHKVKGPFGSCNTCHPNGGTAGRWDSEYKEISSDGDKVIPSLKGIGKKKTPEQLEKIIVLMRSKYKVPIQDSQIKALASYISGL